MASVVNVPRAVFARTVSSLAIITDGLSTSAQGDTESQDETFRTDSPTAFFNTDNGSGNLAAVNGNTEKRKLSDLGKGVELAIPEDQPLHIDATVPTFVTSPPSAGDKSGASGSDSVLADTNVPSPEPAGPVLPRNARFRALARRVGTPLWCCIYILNYLNRSCMLPTHGRLPHKFIRLNLLDRCPPLPYCPNHAIDEIPVNNK